MPPSTPELCKWPSFQIWILFCCPLDPGMEDKRVGVEEEEGIWMTQEYH